MERRGEEEKGGEDRIGESWKEEGRGRESGYARRRKEHYRHVIEPVITEDRTAQTFISQLTVLG